MKPIFALLLALAMTITCAADRWAYLSADLNTIQELGEFSDAFVAEQKGRFPTPDRWRPVVEVAVPQATEVQVVVDQGYTITTTNVLRSWLVRSMTTNELGQVRTNRANSVGREMERRIRADQWEPGLTRLLMLQLELSGLIVKMNLGANLQTNLTVGERTRAVTLTNEIVKGFRYWKDGQALRQFALTNVTIPDITSSNLWSTNVIGE